MNRQACARIARRLPHTRVDINDLYDQDVALRMLELPPGAVVVDVGGGRSCRVARFRPPGIRLLAVDISEDELRLNRDVDEWRVGDCTHRLPLANGEASMLVSHSAVEHFRSVAGFVAEAARVLRPGGWFINTFPCRFALFALINQLLPRSVSRAVLRTVFPGSEGTLGYVAHYRRCYPSGFAPLLRRSGFALENLMVGYSQSSYFDFFLPFYLASLSFELMGYLTQVRDLAAYLVVSARRTGAGRADGR